MQSKKIEEDTWEYWISGILILWLLLGNLGLFSRKIKVVI